MCAGGAEKVTEGTGYVNPYWPSSKAAMKALAPHGFVPLAYMFLDAAGTGLAQAQWFAEKAGDLTGFGIVVDFERAQGGSPTIAQAQAAVAGLRKFYPAHPVGLYAPHWYTGGQNLSFGDWLWASEYVNGSGDPAMLYASVPAAWWAPYGGESPLMLQFTSKAMVAGVSGEVDCSAYHGSAAQLAAAVLPKAATGSPPPSGTPAGGELLSLPPLSAVTIPVGARATESFSITVAGDTGGVVTVTVWFSDGSAAQQAVFNLHNGQVSRVTPRLPWSKVTTVRLRRADTHAGYSASAWVLP